MSTREIPADLNALEITVPLSAFDPSSGRTWIIAQPWDKLLAKYFTSGNYLSAEFDLYAARRAATDSGWRDRLEGADLMATGLMNSRMASPDVDAVLAHRAKIEDALRRIPVDAHLADVDPRAEPLRSTLNDLFQRFRTRGVGVAKVMKTLCQKRPHLLPMLDEYVRQALYNADNEPISEDRESFAAEVVAEIGLFRRVLLWGAGTPTANHPRLMRLAEALSARLATEYGSLPDLVTPVRVLDNLIWFEWGGRDHYGWFENETTRRVEKRT